MTSVSESARYLKNMNDDDLNNKAQTHMTNLVSLCQGDPDKLAFWLTQCLALHEQECEEFGIVDDYRTAKKEFLQFFVLACRHYFESIGSRVSIALIESDIGNLYMISISFLRNQDGKRICIQLYEGSEADWLQVGVN